MDEKWFKQQQKRIGVTAEDIARKMGRSRTNVSHIYSGNQRMSLDWAKAFAEVLQVPLNEVLERAGVLSSETPQKITAGFNEGDATPWKGKPSNQQEHNAIATVFGGNTAGIDVWTIQSTALQLMGYMPGDHALVDTTATERVRAGDVVLAQIYDWQNGSAKTILRRFDPPILASASPNFEQASSHIVDGNNVVIKGKVIASWRKPLSK